MSLCGVAFLLFYIPFRRYVGFMRDCYTECFSRDFVSTKDMNSVMDRPSRDSVILMLLSNMINQYL